MNRAALLDEYESLTLRCAKLREQLQDAEQRREDVRALLTAEDGAVVNIAPNDSPPSNNIAAKPTKRKSAYDHMKRKVPAQAVKEVYELAKERGKIGVQDVVARFGIASGAAALRLSRAVKAGWLVRSAHGLYEADAMPP